MDTVELLLKNGAEINREGSTGMTALDYAEERGNEKIADFLKSKGAKNGARALLIDIRRRDPDKVKLRLENKADPNAKVYPDPRVPKNFTYPLNYAVLEAIRLDSEKDKEAYSNMLKKIELLITHGANKNLIGTDGKTPLMHAAGKGNTVVAELLLRESADVNAKDGNGNTALMFAVQNNQIEIVKLLLKYGADVNAKNSEGESASDMAKKQNNSEITKLLKNAIAKSKREAGK